MVEAGLMLLLDRAKNLRLHAELEEKQSCQLNLFFVFPFFRNPKGTVDSVHLPQLSHTEKPFLLASGISGLLR